MNEREQVFNERTMYHGIVYNFKAYYPNYLNWVSMKVDRYVKVILSGSNGSITWDKLISVSQAKYYYV